MPPRELAYAVLEAARDALAERGLDVSVLPATTNVKRPRNPEHGDYASTLALQLAQRVGLAPRELAAAIATRLGHEPGVKSTEIAGPGFVNIRLEAAATGGLARLVLRQGRQYGRTEALAGQRIFLWLDSPNPAGLVHLERARLEAVGDSLARILAAAGAEVTRAHSANDGGVPPATGSPATGSAATGAAASGYAREYIDDQTAQIDRFADAGELPRAEAVAQLQTPGYQLTLAGTKASVERFGFATGGKAHFAAEAADPNQQPGGFDHCVFLLDATHPGSIGRLKALAAGAADGPEPTPEVLIGRPVRLLHAGEPVRLLHAGEPVRLLHAGEPVRLGKRAGTTIATTIALDELVEAVGVDAARYSLVRSPIGAPLTLDLAVITRHAPENPAYRVRYVAARTASICRNAAALGLSLGADFDPGLLTHENELALLQVLGNYPDVIATAAELREPHRVTRYLEDLAATYHRFFDECRVLPSGDEPVSELMRSRLWLNAATRVVVANGLELLGVSAPERI